MSDIPSTSTIVSICHDNGCVFFRDSNDDVFLLASEGGRILSKNSSTEDVLDFINNFPKCRRCVPIAIRRRKAVKSAIKLLDMASSQEDEWT